MRISEDLFKYFEAVGVKKTYKPKEIIFLQNEKADSLFLITRGRVRVFNITDAEQEITLEILERGRIFGESSLSLNATRPTSVAAVTDVSLISCKMEDLLPYFAEAPELAMSILRHLNETCNHLTFLLEIAYTYDRYQKIAALLLKLTEGDNPDQGIVDNTIPYTHEELGYSLGLSRVTVSRILKEFESAGYISYTYKRIRVVDRPALRRVIDERRK